MCGLGRRLHGEIKSKRFNPWLRRKDPHMKYEYLYPIKIFDIPKIYQKLFF